MLQELLDPSPLTIKLIIIWGGGKGIAGQTSMVAMDWVLMNPHAPMIYPVLRKLGLN